MKALLRKFIVTAVASCAVLYAAGADDNSRSRQAADADTLIVFRFAPGSTAFLRQGNDTALLRATRLVELHRTALEAGQAHLLVKGYCSSFGLPEAGQQCQRHAGEKDEELHGGAVRIDEREQQIIAKQRKQIPKQPVRRGKLQAERRVPVQEAIERRVGVFGAGRTERGYCRRSFWDRTSRNSR